jgi:hypothetical protein
MQVQFLEGWTVQKYTHRFATSKARITATVLTDSAILKRLEVKYSFVFPVILIPKPIVKKMLTDDTKTVKETTRHPASDKFAINQNPSINQTHKMPRRPSKPDPQPDTKKCVENVMKGTTENRREKGAARNINIRIKTKILTTLIGVITLMVVITLIM